MKKLITYTSIVLLTLTLFTLLSCEKEDSDCKCNAKFISSDGEGEYTVPNLPIDCETRQPSASNANTGGGYFYGCKNK